MCDQMDAPAIEALLEEIDAVAEQGGVMPNPDCETCAGTGRVWFCPSSLDKCDGCEHEPCPDCGEVK